jgi:large subunit ribosomal protein L13
MKTYVPKMGDVQRAWWIVDASNMTLGRLSTVVVNAEKIKLSGKKLTDKIYRHHSLYPGGLKEIAAGKLLQSHPERLVETAVKGMLPKNSLGKAMARKLKVYVGPEHPHQAQQPKPLAIPGALRN